MYHYPNIPSVGTSSVVYALEGSLLVFNIEYFITIVLKSEMFKKESFLFNIITALLISINIAMDLLNMRALIMENVNVLIHWVAFYIGIIITFIWFIIRQKYE